MKVYEVIELSSGEERLSLDSSSIFANRDDAIKELKQIYKKIKSYSKFCEVTQDEYDITYYSVILEDDCEDTIYEGYIQEQEVR